MESWDKERKKEKERKRERENRGIQPQFLCSASKIFFYVCSCCPLRNFYRALISSFSSDNPCKSKTSSFFTEVKTRDAGAVQTILDHFHNLERKTVFSNVRAHIDSCFSAPSVEEIISRLGKSQDKTISYSRMPYIYIH